MWRFFCFWLSSSVLCVLCVIIFPLHSRKILTLTTKLSREKSKKNTKKTHTNTNSTKPSDICRENSKPVMKGISMTQYNR